MKSSIVSKKNVRTAFSRAASTYDCHAEIQQEVNRLLMSKLSPRAFGNILEIGCGTGSLTQRILAMLPRPKRIVAVDLSHDMVVTSKDRTRGHDNVFFVCCDAEILPLRREPQFDLIISASAMQWFNHFGPTIEGLAKRHLKKNGLFLVSLFGRNTLKELSFVLSAQFPSKDTTLPTAFFPRFPEDIYALSPFFTSLDVQRITIEKKYPDLLQLLRVFKMTGVSPRRDGRPPLFSSPEAIAKLQGCYLERFGSITASFEVIIISAIGY